MSAAKEVETANVESAKEKLIVALDFSSAREARETVAALRGLVGMFKVGSRLFTAAGPGIVRELVTSGERVFLDLKFHDIPNTVAAAGVEATLLGVSLFNVHAAGGREMMQRTAEAVSRTAEKEGMRRPAVLAVTVLTSVDATTLSDIGCVANPEQQVGRLAQLAEASEMDGVVVSAREIKVVRSTVERAGFLVVVPGVRPSGTELEDQKRVATPAQAIRAGADYLVVGRPVIKAENPVAAVRRVTDEIAAAGKGEPLNGPQVYSRPT